MTEKTPWSRDWAHWILEEVPLRVSSVHNPGWVQDPEAGRRITDFSVEVPMLILGEEAELVGTDASIGMMSQESEFSRGTVFAARGTTIWLEETEDIHDLLDRRDDALARFGGLFDDDGDFTQRVQELTWLGPYPGVHLVVIDELAVAPAWRRFGLGARFTRWLMDAVGSGSGLDLYVVRSCPLGEEPTEDEQAGTDQFWESLGFQRVGLDIFIRFG